MLEIAKANQLSSRHPVRTKYEDDGRNDHDAYGPPRGWPVDDLRCILNEAATADNEAGADPEHHKGQNDEAVGEHPQRAEYCRPRNRESTDPRHLARAAIDESAQLYLLRAKTDWTT